MTTQNRFAPFSRENPAGYQTRELTVERAASEDGALTIAISSEAPVMRWDWELRENGGYYLEVLDHGPDGPDLSYTRDGIPFCLDHELCDQIGIGTPPTVDGDRVLRTTLTQGNHPDAAWVFADMRGGIRNKVSIGYWPGDNYQQTKMADGSIVRRFFGWTIYEASSVAVPADYAVGVGRSARDAATSQESLAAAAPAQSQESCMAEATQERGASPAPAHDTRAAELSALATNAKMEARLAGWITNGVTVDAARSEVIASLTAAAERAAPIAASAPVITVGTEREADKPFATFGEYLRDVRNAELSPESTAPRLRALRAGIGMQEGVGSEGGFLIPPQYASGITTRAFQGGNILSRVRRVNVSSNRYAVNVVDETSRVAGSRWGGIVSSWLAEGSSPTASRPTFRQQYFDSKKISVLGYVTEEQLEDYAATSTILEQGFTEELTFELERTIIEGTGSGQPLGILNAGAVVTQAAEGGQTATTVNINNVAKMYARLWSRSMNNAVWLINQDVLPQIAVMTLGNFPIYLAPGQASNGSSFGLLFGRPVIVTEYNSTLGAVGDILLVDLDQYLLAERVGPTMQQSMHVRFVQGEQAFRMIYRVDGAPLWNAPLTPLKGSNTQSPFIALAAR